jgi:hypothetical protein
MVRSDDPRRDTLRAIQWPQETATLFGSLAAETILASGVEAAQTGRTHGRKQPDRNSAAIPCKPGAVHTWIAVIRTEVRALKIYGRMGPQVHVSHKATHSPAPKGTFFCSEISPSGVRRQMKA